MSKIDERNNVECRMQNVELGKTAPDDNSKFYTLNSTLGKLIQQYCPDLPAGRQEGWSITLLPNDETRWYTYVLLCNNGALYKGFTNNLYKRFKRHCDGDGAEYTKKHKPLGVVYYEMFSSQDEAVKREKYFKSGSGREWLKEKIKEVIYDRCK